MAEETRPEFVTEADNWYGVLDPKERKKIQDRLAQRARRKRLAEAREARDPQSKTLARKRRGRLAATFGEDEVIDEEEILARATARAMESVKEMIEDVKVARQYFLSTRRYSSLGGNDPITESVCRGLLEAFENSDGFEISSDGETTVPEHDPFTPILKAITAAPFPPANADPFFLNIPPITVYAALWHNGLAIGIKCVPTPIKHFSNPRHARPSSGVPADLRPTELQLGTSHMTWIDRFPFPKFRDNMIRYTNAGQVDAEEFMRDLFTMKSFNLLPGGSSWDAKSWRLNPEFGIKWGFVFV